MEFAARRWWCASAVALGMLGAGAAPGVCADSGAIVMGQGQTVLLNVAAADAGTRVKPNTPQVSVAGSQNPAAPGLVVTVQPGAENYPGVNIYPDPEGKKVWDASAFGHVEARVVNTGVKPIAIGLEPWNGGDWRLNPFNCETINLKPGEKGTVKVIFGYSYGMQKGYKLDAAAVTRVMLFAGKSDAEQSFRIESLEVGGPAGEKPPVDPASVRIKPKDGVILGSGAAFAARQMETKGLQCAISGGGLAVSFPATNDEQWVRLRPEMGSWDLREASQVRVKVKNTGRVPVTPWVRVTSRGDWEGASAPTDGAAPSAIAPGASQEIIAAFAAKVPWKGKPAITGGVPGTGTEFNSERVNTITIAAAHEGEASMLVELVVAEAPPIKLPDWTGKRPPVDGQWIQTLNESFDGDKLNEKVWTPRLCWDGPVQLHVYSEKNVIVEGGYLKIKSERKHGHEYDDPNLGERDFTSGAVTTLGKWMQKYGYIEARMKSPKALGLWPCFWLMPDRGEGHGDIWQRRNTGDGGMEVDIWEHLTSFGPYHYNIACHWDGYGEEHKATGFWLNYNELDAEGFVVAGLLWEPGRLTWFCNGKPVSSWECGDRVGTVPEYIKLTTQIGGWAGDVPEDHLLTPEYFVIDYVRAWQRKDLAVDGGGKQATPAVK